MSDAYEGFALLELMGHRKRVGRVCEADAYGGKLLRIDVLSTEPDGDATTEFYGCTSIYCLTPLSEEAASHIARRFGIPPVRPVTLQLTDEREESRWDEE